MEIEFRTKNPKQIEAAEAWIDTTTQEILYGGAKGGGKSYMGCSLIFGDALIYPDTHYFIARQELIDLRKFTIPSIHERFKHWGLDIEKYAHFNGQDNVFNLYNGSKVFLIPCKETPSDPLYERFGSMQMTRGWIEEAGEVVEAAKNNLWLSIGRWKNDEYKLKKKLLMTANPKKGWMKRDFVDPFKAGLLPPSRKYIQAFATDNTYLPEDYLKTLSEQKDSVSRQRLWEGIWDYDEDKDSLISYDALTDTFSNTITKNGQRYMIIDVARLGRDSTVFSFFDGLELYKIEKYEKQSTTTTIQKAKDLAATHRIPYSNILIDEDGIGGSVVDGMFGVKGFVANSTALPTATEIKMRENKVNHSLIPKRNFKNLKAQCGWKLAELINEHQISFAVPEYRDTILEEIPAILRKKNVDSESKLELRSKEDVKLEIGHSPDVGDTLMMRAWFELATAAMNEDPKRAVVVEEQVIRMSRNRKNMAQNSSE